MDSEDGQRYVATTNTDFYQWFDARTGSGKVLKIDFSSNDKVTPEKLEDDEVDERTEYYDTLQELYDMYFEAKHPVCCTKEDVLQQRIVAPSLEAGKVSNRTKPTESRAVRLYPPKNPRMARISSRG
jgi:hypothetical protein